MKKSEVIGRGIWQWEWVDDKIAVAKWDIIPSSTYQWVNICPDVQGIAPKYTRFCLERNNNDDIRVVPID